MNKNNALYKAALSEKNHSSTWFKPVKMKPYVLYLCLWVSTCKSSVSNRKYYDGILPEIVINDKPNNIFSGYQYPVPGFPPVFLDETTTQGYPIYGPPGLDLPQFNISNDFPDYPSYLPPSVTLRPPLFDEPPNDDEDTVVIPLPPTNGYLPPNSYQSSPNNAQVRIINMTCFNSPNQYYFRAILHTPQRSDLVPVIEDAPADCISGSGDVYRLDLQGERMKRCGVRYCSNGDQVNMCVGIRIPTVRGLKMLEDMSLTLQCRPQERVVSHTKQLRFNAQNV